MTKNMLTFGFAAVVAMGSFALFGSVYDDAFWWFNQPREKDGTGTAGVEQPEGLYGATGSGASHEVAWITSGKLRVGSAGTMFIIK